MKIAIIGAGWYGAHIARILSQNGHQVVILEAGDKINFKVSGMFGVRDHAGPHYPRSKKTRESCHRGSEDFEKHYPNLIIQHQYSIYALGANDVDGLHPKVTPEEFEAVCKESVSARKIDLELWGYDKNNVIVAFDLHEPSIVVGKKLRLEMIRYLEKDNVKVICNYPVTKVERKNDNTIKVNDELEFDFVINATSFQSLLPEKSLPFLMDVKYQVCLALVYEDLMSTAAPFSFIVMDGWFPCMMPYDDRTDEERHLNRNYIMTHGKWTIMGSFDTPEEARELLGQINDKFVDTKVRPRCEADMKRFWPEFSGRFRYKGWVGNSLAKIRSDKEFRSAVTFADDKMIYVLPGKVTNIGDAAKEVLFLINEENVIRDTTGVFRYVQNGVLDDALQEITDTKASVRNTCDLQTFQELMELPAIGDNSRSSSEPSAPGIVVWLDRARQDFRNRHASGGSAPLPISHEIKHVNGSSNKSLQTAAPVVSERKRLSATF